MKHSVMTSVVKIDLLKNLKNDIRGENIFDEDEGEAISNLTTIVFEPLHSLMHGK